MTYEKTVTLKNGKTLVLRSGTEADAEEVCENFNLTHSETDFLLSYPDENNYTVEEEAEFLKKKAESENEVEILAVLDGVITGTACIEAIGSKFKVKHRTEFGISIAKEYWHLGIGRALINACIECAKKAGYAQMELTVISSNEKAVALYESVGFTEYGRNPKGFNSRYTGWQEVILMRKEL